MVLPLAFGLIAAIQVARIRVVPAPWNWTPLWALGIHTAAWVIPQLINVTSPTMFVEIATITSALGTVGFLTTTLGLGIVAVVLSNRSHARTVPIFESSPAE